MGFSDMLEILQQKNKGKIVFVKLGNFYTATGRDAVLLNVKLDLKCNCYKNNICKVGFPVSSIEKYLEKLNKTKYSYVIYDYDKNKNELILKYEKKGRINKITDKNKNCLICKGINQYKEDEYMLALIKLFESNNKESEINNERRN